MLNEVKKMKQDSKELIKVYFEQDEKEQNTTFDDELRAEADLCSECCACCKSILICLS